MLLYPIKLLSQSPLSHQYLTACLTSIQEDTDKIAKFIMEARRLSIKILPPDVNESLANFTVVGEKKIRFDWQRLRMLRKRRERNLTRRKKLVFKIYSTLWNGSIKE